MSLEPYQARVAIELISWVRRDPERAFDTGMKLIGVGAAIVILAALLSE